MQVKSAKGPKLTTPEIAQKNIPKDNLGKHHQNQHNCSTSDLFFNEPSDTSAEMVVYEEDWSQCPRNSKVTFSIDQDRNGFHDHHDQCQDFYRSPFMQHKRFPADPPRFHGNLNTDQDKCDQFNCSVNLNIGTEFLQTRFFDQTQTK
jgi:hypothetical protein